MSCAECQRIRGDGLCSLFILVPLSVLRVITARAARCYFGERSVTAYHVRVTNQIETRHDQHSRSRCTADQLRLDSVGFARTPNQQPCVGVAVASHEN